MKVFERVKDIVGKGENAGYQHFLHFPLNVFQTFTPKIVKSQNCVVKNQTLKYSFYKKWK